MRLPFLSLRCPEMSLPKFISPAIRTTNFDHVVFDLPTFATQMADPAEFDRVRIPFVGRAATILAPRFKAAHAHLFGKPQIPQDVRDEAQRYSRELVFSLNVFKSKITRGQSHGSLDSSKLARLASPGLSVREFDRLAASAYRRREHVQAVTTRPRIAIVGDMNNEIRSSNPSYMRMLGRLAYVVAEAAKLSGVEVALYGSRGWHSNGSADVDTGRRLVTATGGAYTAAPRRPHVATTLKGWNADVSGGAYALFTDATSFAFSTILWAALHKLTPDRMSSGMTSDCGAGGIEYARAQGANLVIAFGNFDASENADMTFDPADSVETVVQSIVRALAKQKAA